jgi:hypothetical protein
MSLWPEDSARKNDPDYVCSTAFRRAGRDLEHLEGKPINLSVEFAPGLSLCGISPGIKLALGFLLHCIVRNSVEGKKERAAAGKDRMSRIRVEMESVGGKIVLRLSDDGRGLTQEDLRGRSRMWFDRARRLIELENGTLELGTRSDGGTKVLVEIEGTAGLVRLLILRIKDLRFGIPSTQVSEILKIDSDTAWLIVRQGFYEHEGELYALYDTRHKASFETLDSLVVALVGEGDHRFCIMADGFEGIKELRYEPFPIFLQPSEPWNGVATSGEDIVLGMTFDTPPLDKGSVRAERLDEEKGRDEIRAESPDQAEPIILLVGSDSALSELSGSMERSGVEVARASTPLAAVEAARRKRFSAIIIGRGVPQIAVDMMTRSAKPSGKLISIVDHDKTRIDIDSPEILLDYPFKKNALSELRRSLMESCDGD